MFPEGINTQMVEFNRNLADKSLLAIQEFRNRVEQGDQSKRKAWQEELWKILSVANLNLNDVRGILEYFKIVPISGKLPSLKELSEMLIPGSEEDGGNTYEVTDLKDVFVTTNKVDQPVTKGGETPFREPETIERTKMLVDFLKENGIEVKSYHILKGQNTPEMMRKESYALFIIPSIDSMVLVCDEEGNVTFVIRDLPVDPKQYYSLTKDELKAHPKVAPHIRWSEADGVWEHKILDALTDPRTIFDKTVVVEVGDVVKDGVSLNDEHLVSPGNKIEPMGDRESCGPAPEGWMTEKAIRKMTGKQAITIQKIVQPYSSARREWFVWYRDKIRRPRVHFSPELIDIIKEKTKSPYERAPKGWLNYGDLHTLTLRSRTTIMTKADEYRLDHKDWFGTYVDEDNIKSEYVHPDLAAILKEKLTEYEKALEGWKTISGLIDILEREHVTIASATEKYREEHEDWFEMYLDEYGHPREHLSPKLIEELKKEFNMYEKAPAGWLTASKIYEIVRGDYDKITEAVKRYKDSNPEWKIEIVKYLDEQNNARDHFSPKLVEILIKELSK